MQEHPLTSTHLILGKSHNNSQRLVSLTAVHRESEMLRSVGARGASEERPLRDGSDPERSSDSKLEHFDKAWQLESLAGENLATNVSRRLHIVTIEEIPASPKCRQPERSSAVSNAPPKFVTICRMAVKLYRKHMGSSRACRGEEKHGPESSRIRRSLTMLAWDEDILQRRR